MCSSMSRCSKTEKSKCRSSSREFSTESVDYENVRQPIDDAVASQESGNESSANSQVYMFAN